VEKNIMSVEIIRETENEITIKCAFCNGKGTDPFELLSEISICQVCGAKGMVSINEPIEKCSDCNGKGVCAGAYLPCLTCGGTGVVSKK
jgi:DnaJ-class molecular chaperone